MYLCGFDLPDHRPAGCVSHLDPPPFLAREGGTVPTDIVHALGRMRRLARTIVRPFRPAPEVGPCLTDAPLAEPVQFEPEFRHAAVVLVKRQIAESHAF